MVDRFSRAIADYTAFVSKQTGGVNADVSRAIPASKPCSDDASYSKHKSAEAQRVPALDKSRQDIVSIVGNLVSTSHDIRADMSSSLHKGRAVHGLTYHTKKKVLMNTAK